MKFQKIKRVFEDNNNRWMTSTELFDYFNNTGYKWGKNIRGIQGHKNTISRDLSERYISKLEVDKSVTPQKYRIIDLGYDERNHKDDYEEGNESEISIGLIENILESDDIGIESESNQDDLDVNKKEDMEDTFQLIGENLQFKKYDIPLKGKSGNAKKKRRNTPRKVDYEKKAIMNKIKGNLGEEAVVRMEENNLRELGREDLANDVVWVSKNKGDGLGYDIESWKMLGKRFEKVYIEVKTTTGDIDTPFDISDKEIFVSKEFGDKYFIYRLFGVEKVTRKINYYIIEGDVERQFDLVPTSFKAYFKID